MRERSFRLFFRMISKLNRIGLISLLLFTLGSCKSPRRLANEDPVFDADGTEIRRAELPSNSNETLSFVTSVNDAARYLAGMPGGINSALGELRRTPRWQLHRANVDELWRQFSVVRQPRIDSFARRELGGLRSMDTVLYPFSGPDILFAHAFFPNATNYILCGLEGTDPLPALSSLTNEDRENGLDGVYTSITTALNCSFFITKDMRVDLQRTVFKGTLPIVLVFAARLGMDVESVEPISLTAGGVVQYGVGGKCPGYVVKARSGFGTKNFYYFQENLANGNLGNDPRFLRFTQHFGPVVTYLKSASYLMHTDDFSRIRSGILDQSAGVLEDDSGIPLRSFQDGRWSLNFYGKYDGVLDIFNEYYQPDLASAFHNGGGSVEGLNFGVGYKFLEGQSALILARRR